MCTSCFVAMYINNDASQAVVIANNLQANKKYEMNMKLK